MLIGNRRNSVAALDMEVKVYEGARYSIGARLPPSFAESRQGLSPSFRDRLFEYFRTPATRLTVEHPHKLIRGVL